MLPPPGDAPLHIVFGIVPLVIAALIFVFIAVKLGKQWVQRRAVLARGKMLDEFAHYPELQAIEGSLRLGHHRVLSHAEARATPELAATADAVLDQGLDAAKELRDAGENMPRVAAAREELAKCAREFEQLLEGER